MSLGIRLNARLKKPLYQQLVEAISEKIVGGDFEAGDRLPSVRDLAMDVRINPNTVARAYQELEKAALVESQRGRGFFVLPAAPTSADLPVELERAISRVIETAQDLDFPLERLDNVFRRRLLAVSRQEPDS